MRFGFIAHPTSVKLKRYVKMLDLMVRTSKDLHNGYERKIWQRQNTVPFIDFGIIRSATGAVCGGAVYYMPMTAEEMLKSSKKVQKKVLDIIDEFQEQGAGIVGLGGFTSIVGKRGLDVASQSGLPVTSGNSLTTYAAFKALMKVLDWLQILPQNAKVAIIGYPGSICLSLSKMLLEMGCSLDLVYRSSGMNPDTLMSYLPSKWHDSVSLIADIEDCYTKNRLFVAATSSGNVIDANKLLQGSVVIDIALPRDAEKLKQSRNDILVIDGGYVTASSKVKLGSESLNMAMKQQINGCLAETMVLTLEERMECFSIGRTLEPEKVMEMGEIAERHGFEVLPLASYGERINKETVTRMRRFHKLDLTRSSLFASSVRTETGTRETLLSNEDRRALTLQRYASYINPMMAEFLRLQRCDQVFESAKECTLTDIEGHQFLDMVAGFGCLNLGHNPKSVTEAIQNYLQQSKPNFVQYVSLPQEASKLAELLCEITPGNLERVFFSNSGTEGVEAALKLAKAANARSRVIYAHNSYHGKTLGSLSVTGRDKHQKYFRPLIPACVSVPFGDLETLKKELEVGDVSAFIIEPIQGEGGVHLPPEGYLASAEALCRDTSTLFIVDEIQTGLGRTGRMFASEWENIEPDILILSKSLSGGVMPIAATLCKAETWDLAYGTSQRFVLHTSTFGGGNLSCVAGQAAIESILEQGLPERAAELGAYFKSELERVTEKYPFIKEIRGRGLMLGIQFKNNFSGAIDTFGREFGTRLPGDWHLAYKFLPDEVKQHVDVAKLKMEEAFEEMFCMRFVTKLNNDHRILTYVTANSSTVMRIQPPLIISKQEIDHFITSFAIVCEDMSTFLN